MCSTLINKQKSFRVFSAQKDLKGKKKDCKSKIETTVEYVRCFYSWHFPGTYLFLSNASCGDVKSPGMCTFPWVHLNSMFDPSYSPILQLKWLGNLALYWTAIQGPCRTQHGGRHFLHHHVCLWWRRKDSSTSPSSGFTLAFLGSLADLYSFLCGKWTLPMTLSADWKTVDP